MIAISSDGQKVAAASEAGPVELWSLPGQQRLAVLSKSPERWRDLQFSSDDSLLAAIAGPSGAQQKGRLFAWQLSSGEQAVSHFHENFALPRLAVAPNHRIAATANRDAVLWNDLSSPILDEFRVHRNVARFVAFSADSRLLATTSWDGTGRVWEISKKELLWELKSTRFGFRSLGFSPDVRRLVAVSEGRAILWDTETRQEVASFALDGLLGAYFLDADTLIGNSHDVIKVWRAPSWKNIGAKVREVE